MPPSPPTGFTFTHEPNGRFFLQDSDTRERAVDIQSRVPHGLTLAYRSGEFTKPEVSNPPTPIAQHRTRVRCCFEVCFSIAEPADRFWARIKTWFRLAPPTATAPPSPPHPTTTAEA